MQPAWQKIEVRLYTYLISWFSTMLREGEINTYEHIISKLTEFVCLGVNE